MIKRDYYLEEVEAKWPMLPWWLKLKIVIMITWYTWDSKLAKLNLSSGKEASCAASWWLSGNYHYPLKI